MADITVKSEGAEVLARKYVFEKDTVLKGVVGTVRGVEDGVITVDFGEGVGERKLRASHIMLNRGDGNGNGLDGKGGSSSAASSDQSGTAEGSATNALDPNAKEISDADVRQLRSQQPPASERKRLIEHLLDPSNPEYGGEEGHDHGAQERAESTIRSGSVDDLKAWHANAHKVPTPDGLDHP